MLNLALPHFPFRPSLLVPLYWESIIKFQQNQPYICFAAILVTLIVLTVCRIGNYKFATANRHNGFELYLDSLKSKQKAYPNLLDDICWEAALRAWRIVQATIFSELLYTKLNTRWWNIVKRWNYNKIKKSIIISEIKNRQKEDTQNAQRTRNFNLVKKYEDYNKIKNSCQRWFNTGILTNDYGVKWYPGRYLHTMQKVLEIIAVISLFPLGFAVLQFQFCAEYSSFNFICNNISVNGFALITVFILFVSVIAVVVNIHHINTRRKVLESGLLSIHTCSVLWQVVSIVHHRAIKGTGNDQNKYLENLVKETEELKKYVTDIYGWVRKVGGKNKSFRSLLITIYMYSGFKIVIRQTLPDQTLKIIRDIEEVWR